MWTRKQYMAGEVSHHEYYSQFVTQRVISFVRSHIKESRIMQSTDPHMNDIPLFMWDEMHGVIEACCREKLKQAGQGGVSLSDTVCIAKTAARMIKEEL